MTQVRWRLGIAGTLLTAALLAQVSLLRPDLHDQAALLLLEMNAHGPHEPK